MIILRYFTALIFLILGPVSALPVIAAAYPDFPMEIVAASLNAQNGYQWNAAYDIGVKNDTIRIRVGVNLVPADGITTVALDQVKTVWQSKIEQIWSKKFCVRDMEGNSVPIVMTLDFSGPDFHHDVIVKAGGRCCSDVLNWHIMDSPLVIAHEFGHMLGAYDEYAGGALDPQTGLLDPTSIMTSRPETARIYPRHLKSILLWFTQKTGTENMVLEAIDQSD